MILLLERYHQNSQAVLAATGINGLQNSTFHMEKSPSHLGKIKLKPITS